MWRVFHTHTHTHAHTRAHTHTHTYTHTPTHTHTHIHRHTHTHNAQSEVAPHRWGAYLQRQYVSACAHKYEHCEQSKNAHIYKCTCVYMYICIYVCIHYTHSTK